jgi:DNA modification methylase
VTDLLRIEYIPLDQARRWDRNPKKHDAGAIAASIERHGFKDPPKFEPLLNGGEGGIVEGNGRIEVLEAMRAQGRKAPRGVLAQDDQWLIPLLFGVDAASQAAAESYGVDHNNLVLSGGDYTAVDMMRLWEPGAYTDILQGLEELGELPISVDADDLATLLSLDEIEPGAGGDEFDTTPQDGPTRAQAGDLWVIGNKHRLVVGDCTDPAMVERLMGGERAKVGIHDPPYGIKRDKGFEGFEGFGGFGPPIARRQYDDDWDGDRPTRDAFDLLLSVAPVSIIWGGNYFADLLPQGKHWIVWDKNNTMPTFGDCELAWTNVARTSVKKYELTYNGLIGKEAERYHPTQKPVKLIEMALEDYTEADDLTVDFYIGSGTTLIAAHRTGRRCYGCEISPRYADVILRRAEAEGLTVERATDE